MIAAANDSQPFAGPWRYQLRCVALFTVQGQMRHFAAIINGGPVQDLEREEMKNRILRDSAILIVIFIIARMGVAQALYGSITGNVTDSSGALVPEANVSAKQIDTNEMRTAVTNGNGEYTLVNFSCMTSSSCQAICIYG
jgi:hypothetical protein